MDLALNKLQRLICHKTQTNKRKTDEISQKKNWTYVKNGYFKEKLNPKYTSME